MRPAVVYGFLLFSLAIVAFILSAVVHGELLSSVFIATGMILFVVGVALHVISAVVRIRRLSKRDHRSGSVRRSGPDDRQIEPDPRTEPER